MKKLFILLASLFVVMSLVGCSSNKEENNQIANPWVEVDSLDEASKITGFTFDVPDTLDGKSITLIQVMNDELIEVRYDDDIIFRKGKGSEDYSGDFNSYEITRTENINDVEVTLKGSGDTYNCVTFIVDDYSYSITTNNGLSLDAISDVINNGR